MRYAFIVNPVSGQGGHDKGIVRNIKSLITNHPDEDIGLYYSMQVDDASALADTLAEEAMKAGDDIVVFGCGGDGTAHEIANGIYGYDNAVLGLVPTGSGNDLVRAVSRNYGNYKDYLNPEKQLKGEAVEIDVLEISWKEKGKERKCIAVNGINIGFDGNTAIRAAELKEKPLLSGSLAYIIAVFSTLVRKAGQSLRIRADGEDFFDGDLLLSTIANGNYCGGGIESCPRAMLDDGLIELMAIKDISRLSFIQKFPGFRAGKIFEMKGMRDKVTYKQAKSVSVQPLLGDTMKYVVDGEMFNTSSINIELTPKALSVWVIK